MSTEPALLAAIAAAPDDDTPRLVYADWLDENGQDEKAEFFRGQVALSQNDCADKAATQKRVTQLLNMYKPNWISAALPGMDEETVMEIEDALDYRRGVVSVLTVTPENFELINANKDAIFQAFPTISAIQVEVVPGALEVLTQSPHFPKHIRGVSLLNHFRDVNKHGVIVGTSAERNEALATTASGEVVDDNIAATQRDIQALATHASFSGLRTLTLNNDFTGLIPDGYNPLFHSANAQHIKTLRYGTSRGYIGQIEIDNQAEINLKSLKRLEVYSEYESEIRPEWVSDRRISAESNLQAEHISTALYHNLSSLTISGAREHPVLGEVLGLEHLRVLKVPGDWFINKSQFDSNTDPEAEEKTWALAKANGFKHLEHVHFLLGREVIAQGAERPIKGLLSLPHLDHLKTFTVHYPVPVSAAKTLLDCHALSTCRFNFKVGTLGTTLSGAEKELQRKVDAHNAALTPSGPGGS